MCGASGTVTELVLGVDKNLTGPLPNAMSELTTLQVWRGVEGCQGCGVRAVDGLGQGQGDQATFRGGVLCHNSSVTHDTL